MVAFEDRARLKRVKSEQAINLAMQSKWQEAAEVNRQLLELFPNDVDAYNRLGKALMELGRYAEARDAYSRALKLDPLNTIAQKNLQRLTKLAEEAAAAAPPPARVDPRLFIEEAGRTTTTNLVALAPPEVLARLTAGDELRLEVAGASVRVLDGTGEVVGKLEPKLGNRIIKLLELGNRYSAAVTGADERSVRVIIREVERSPKMGNRPSFPTTAEAFRGYIKDVFREEEEEEEVAEETLEELEPGPELDLGLEEPPLAGEADLTEEA